jgi:Alcohol dehydrogenase GroES-like domain
VEDDVPQPGPGEVRQGCWPPACRSPIPSWAPGTYLGVPKPPFTRGYELVGVVEELGPGCARLKVGDRIGARRFAGRFSGATGLEPATSGGTGRSWCLRGSRGVGGDLRREQGLTSVFVQGLPGIGGSFRRPSAGCARCDRFLKCH